MSTVYVPKEELTMAANQNPQTQPAPQTTQAQPRTVQVQHVHKHEHHHHNDNSGFGWGSVLLAGLAGIVVGSILQEENKPEPVVQKHFWQS